MPLVENRIDACTCLVNLLKDRKVQNERQVCRAVLERLSRQVLFSSDSYIRTLMARELFSGNNSCCALSEEYHIEHLVTRSPTLEVNNITISQGARFFVKRGVFGGSEAVVKVMYVTNQNVWVKLPPDCLQAEQRLTREAYFLCRLQTLKHPNFPILLSYNTVTMPYHLITGYESQGSLLELLQESHVKHSLLEVTVLLQMLINIADALQTLAQLGLVHRSVMAENVLVGDSHVCKLNGLHSVQPITWEPLTKGTSNNS